MKIIVAPDASRFLDLAHDWLMRNEVEHTVILGIAGGIASGAVVPKQPPFYAVVLGDDESIAAVAIRTPPHKLVMSSATPEAVAVLVRTIFAAMPDLPAVNGPEPAAGDFARGWAKLARTTPRIGMRQRLYVARTVADDLPQVAGALREAADAERPLALAWANAFAQETVPDDRTDRGEFVERVYRLRRLSVWEDGRPVTMVASGGASRNGAMITFVYTPPELRRRGYATAAVAELTRRLLATGKQYCCLYTDLANPTSNAIYQTIGYRAVCDFNDYRLVAATAA